MNTRSMHSSSRRGLAGSKLITIVVAAAVVVTIGVMLVVRSARASRMDAHPMFTVERGPLTISLSESGAIRSRDLVIVRSELEGRATILRLIDEGTHVQAGDILLELDSSQLQENQAQQQITVQNAQAAFIRARENAAVTKSQGESDVAAAELRVQFARLDLTKFLEGEYPQQLTRAQNAITIAEEELQRAQDKVNWSKRLAEEGYITRTELQADELAQTRAQLNLDLARNDLEVLQNFTYGRMLQQLESEVSQSVMALDRVRRRAAADLIQVEADLTARQSELERQQARLARTIEQIEKCVIRAPVSGMVVYATTAQAAGRGRYVEPLQTGQEVRERQELIHLPTSSSMMAEVKIHESSIKRITLGQPVRVSVEAVPGKLFTGRVGRIAIMPDSSWMAPDVKVYNVEVFLEGAPEDLKPGMTCRAEVIIDHFADAVYVPIQCVTMVGRQPMVYVPGPSGPEARVVATGPDNGRMIKILEGLSAGERILLAPPLAPSTADDSTAIAAAPLEPAEPQAPAPAEPSASDSSPAANSPSATAMPQIPGMDVQKLMSMSDQERRQWLESLPAEQQEQVRRAMRARGQNGGSPAGQGGSGRRGPGQGGGQGGTSGAASRTEGEPRP